MKQAVSARNRVYVLFVWPRACLAVAAFGFPLAAWANPYECLIEPNQVVEIRSPSEGLIEKVDVKRGDRVEAGQILVELESSVEQSAAEMAKYRSQMEGRIASSKNRLEFATRKLNRTQELQKQNFVSAQAGDEAEAEKRIAEAELRDAVENQELGTCQARLSARRRFVEPPHSAQSAAWRGGRPYA